MSASGPAHDDPGERESLEELFGSVIGLAGQIASRISRDRVEARLRRMLAEAGYRQEAVPAGEATRPGPAPKLLRDDPVVVVLVGRAAGGVEDLRPVPAERSRKEVRGAGGVALAGGADQQAPRTSHAGRLAGHDRCA